MKKMFVKSLALAGLGVAILSSSASAMVYHYDDVMTTFPGYPYEADKDQIGAPGVEAMHVTINDSTMALENITITMTERRVFDSLFINNDGDGWHAWDYMVRDNWTRGVLEDGGGTRSGSTAYMTWDSWLTPEGVYGVADDYEYTIVPGTATADREYHPNGVQAADLSLLSTDNSFIYWDGVDQLVYDFTSLGDLTIYMGERFSIAYAPWCANDLIGTPVSEPASLLLFGTGLAGLAGISRRRMKSA